MHKCPRGGVLLVDGTAVWIVDDVRDGTPVGAVRGSLYLPAGYVKANGATVQRADYPRLVALAERHNLWTDDTTANAGLFGRGDGVATMVLPNWMDRMVQLTADRIGASVAAGLPNIEGKTGTLDASGGGLAILDGAFWQHEINRPSNFMRQAGNGLNLTAPGANILFNASKYDPIYGASGTVQPPAIKLIPIIRY